MTLGTFSISPSLRHSLIISISPELATLSQQILGDHLLGMQLGNEPDLYHNNKLRLPDYSATDFFNEWGTVINDYQNLPDGSSGLEKKQGIFVAPSVCCGQDIGWTPEVVWDTGFLDAYAKYLSYVSVEQ